MVVRTGSTAAPFFVMHLPEQTRQMDEGVYYPTRTSDLKTEAWPSTRPQINHMGRYLTL